MTGQTDPTCGLVIVDKAPEKEVALYCCEPCATGGQCGCGCCAIVEEKQEQEK